MSTTKIRNHFLILIVFGAVSLAGIGCARKPADDQISQNVKAQLQKDAAINGEVSVESAQGAVTLSGHVSSEAQRQRAAREASEISGVREVINHLTVAPTAPPAAAIIPPPQQAPPSPEARISPRRHRRNRRAVA